MNGRILYNLSTIVVYKLVAEGGSKGCKREGENNRDSLPGRKDRAFVFICIPASLVHFRAETPGALCHPKRRNISLRFRTFGEEKSEQDSSLRSQ